MDKFLGGELVVVKPLTARDRRRLRKSLGASDISLDFVMGRITPGNVYMVDRHHPYDLVWGKMVVLEVNTQGVFSNQWPADFLEPVMTI